GLEHRTGLPFPVRQFEDLFVAAVPKYARCDRFDGHFPHPWNIGDDLRVAAAPTATLAPAPPDQRRQAAELAITGDPPAAPKVPTELDADGVDRRRRALARSDLAALAAAGGDLAAARAGFAAALALNPDCAAALENLVALHRDPTTAAPPPAAAPSR